MIMPEPRACCTLQSFQASGSGPAHCIFSLRYEYVLQSQARSTGAQASWLGPSQGSTILIEETVGKDSPYAKCRTIAVMAFLEDWAGMEDRMVHTLLGELDKDHHPWSVRASPRDPRALYRLRLVGQEICNREVQDHMIRPSANHSIFFTIIIPES